ncbi:MAG: glycosyltransferase family 1 protein [Uliginosibacterium sp.]|nr:glycosyltransferase family 1 protein [Uliginosibacterium sp.]
MKDSAKTCRRIAAPWNKKVHLSGGIFSHDKTLDLKDYAEEIAESKILANTQTVSGRIQVKGRVSQTLSCGTFLLEQENPETREYLKGIPIEFWKDIDELESKITYFLKNEALREEVASNAHKLWKERYSIQKFIDAIVNGIQ